MSMLRLAVVVAMMGLLLVDPILCRADEAAGPCGAACRVGHGPSQPHSSPAESGEESAHGCICQGATGGVDSKSALALAVERLVPGWTADAPIVPTRSPGRGRLCSNPFPTRPAGRLARIERQSFLF
jgi:hypothetical protein